MKIKSKYKKLTALLVSASLASISLASMAFAEIAPTVTWKEKIKTGNTYADQPVTETYDPATGTFKNAENEATTRTVTNTSDGNTHTYYFGVELPTEVKSGTVVVEAYINKPTGCTSDRQITLFGLSDKASGWTTKVTSGLAFRNSNLLGTQKNTANESIWETRWNRDVAPATSGSFTRVGQNNSNHTLRFVASAANESADWDIKIYHKKTNETIPVYTYTIPRSELPDIKCILNSSWYDKSWTSTVTLGVNKFQVTISEEKSPQIVTATDGRVAYDKPLSVTFDSAIDELTIGGIKLMQDQTVVPVDVALESDGKTVTITPKSPLADGQNYQIVIPATVAGKNGLYVGKTVINVTATDALYFSNFASKYNPAAGVTNRGGQSYKFEDNKFVSDYASADGRWDTYKFNISSPIASGVYYADVKFNITSVNAGSGNLTVGIFSSGKTKTLFKADKTKVEITPQPVMVPTDPIVINGSIDWRLIIMSEKDDSDWKVLLYDKVTGSVTHGGIITRTDLEDLKGIYIGAGQANFKASDVVIRKADDVNLINPAYDANSKKISATFATAKSGVAIAAAYGADGRFLEAVSRPLSLDLTTGAPDTLEFPFATEETIEDTKLMVWDGLASCKPLIKAISVTGTDGEDSETEGEGSESLPVSIWGAFYTSDNNTAAQISGNSKLYAKARVVSDEPPQNLVANVSLVQDGKNTVVGTENVIFNENVAEVTIEIDSGTFKEGDKLKFVVMNDEKEYLSKTLCYDAKHTIDILMVAGQSNADGQYADKTLSVKPELGTVYYNTMGTTTLSTDGVIGWSGALGKTWHDRTGHTVLIVKAAWGGTGFEAKSDCYGLWSPDATEEELALCKTNRHCYKEAKTRYNEAVASLDSYLDEGYEIGECVYFWFQGENENKTYTPEQYKDAFMKMHNGFTTEFGTGNTRLTLGGILPVRGKSSTDTISTSLKITGPRAAHSYLSNARSDLIMASTATENWYSDASIKAWFDAKYPNGSYSCGEMPDSINDVWREEDSVHYKQKIHNEFGEEAANSMLDYIEGSEECEGISLIGQTGIKHYKDGDEIVLPETSVSPIISPASNAKTAKYTLTGNAAEMTKYNVITAKSALANDYSILTVTLDNGKTMTFKLYSPIIKDSIVIAPVKDNKASIYTLTTDDGYKATNEYLDTKFEELGLVGTMGLVVNWLGNDGMLTVQEAQSLVSTGRWGVANHTLNHKQTGFKDLSEEELEVEIDGGREKLLEYFPGEKIVGMYTPGGATSDKIVNKVKENHIVLRKAGGGSNSLPITTDKMLNLNVRAIFDDTTLASMNSWINTAIANRQWVCEMWHGIGDDASSWGGNTTTEITDAHLAYVKQKMDDGMLWVTTLDEAGIYSYQRANTQINKISQSDTEIKISITDELNDEIFDAELTINVPLPNGWNSASVTSGSNTINANIKNGVLSFNATNDISEVIITKTN